MVLHVIYGCGVDCPSIATISRLLECPASAVDLLQWLDRLLLFQHSETTCNLIASQDWTGSNSAANYASLFQSLGHFAFASRLRSHLLFFPFSTTTTDLHIRLDIITSLIATSATIIDEWRTMFVTRIRQH